METFDRRMLLGAAGLVGVAALARAGRAGPLDPPAGAVASTAKPLGEVEPRTAITALPLTINTPGSYYLAKSFTVVGATGITIAADNVAIDLMGFTITGSGTGAFSGILSTGARRGLSVRNGTVRSFDDFGVALRTGDASVIEDVLVESCGQSGISVASALVSRCTSRLNTENGIEVSGSGAGVQMRSCMLIDCRATENTQDGFKMDAGTVNNSGGCLLRNCVGNQNGRYGFFAAAEFALENCLARQNINHGYRFGDGCRFEACEAIRNTGSGFDGGGFATIRNCNASDNTQNGFKVNSGCMIVGCRAYSNGGTNVLYAGFTLGGSNVLEENYALNNSQGFFSGSNSFNVITRNVCISNGTSLASNYVVGTGNPVGPQYGAISGANSVLNPYSNVSLHPVP